MFLNFVFFVTVTLASASEFGCYWNNVCSNQLFGTKTPYDAVRGDLRDHPKVAGCKAVSLWSIHRHGNRNPGEKETKNMKNICHLKEQIIQAHEEGRSQLCATDIDDFRKWQWNSTIESSLTYLTGFGYEEIYDIATRVKKVYPELFDGDADDYYFRATNKQRTATSAIAFVHGLTEGTNLTMKIDNGRKSDDVIMPYEICAKYQQLVNDAPKVTCEIKSFKNTSEYQNIRAEIQKRLGIDYQITTEDVYSIYDTCRYYRSWDVRMKDPWCAVFKDEELVVMDYSDDVRHYYKKGYGSWVNIRLGEQPIKDLYENLEAAVQGRGKKIVSYFTHDTIMEMVYSALGLYKDPIPLRGDSRSGGRLWRTSYISPMAINLMAVLNRCEESGIQTYKVQIFIGEKVTDLCPVDGCPWNEFQKRFQPYIHTDLNFCSMNYTDPMPGAFTGGANVFRLNCMFLLFTLLVIER